jgi:hypothetical protein
MAAARFFDEGARRNLPVLVLLQNESRSGGPTMNLFEVAKVGMFLDQITHGVEERRGDEVKIVTLTLRVQPFGPDLARALGGSVRTTLFKLNHPTPHPHLKRVDFRLGCPRQTLTVYASPDTGNPSILFDQGKIVATYARTQKDMDGFAFVVKVSFGPVGKHELEYLQDWLLGQRFVTCEQAEPGLFEDDDTDDDVEEVARPAPMFEDDDEQNGSTVAVAPKRKRAPKKPSADMDPGNEQQEQQTTPEPETVQ